MTTRAQFLQRVRREMGKKAGLFPARSANRPADPGALAQAIRRQLAERWPTAVEQFREEFERVGGSFYRVAGMEDALATIRQIARQRDVQRVLAWAQPMLGAELAAGLRAEGLEVMEEEASGAVDREARARYCHASAQADLGVTSADLAVAETGSLVVISKPGKARSASLLPPYHVAIFSKAALVESLEQVGVILEALHTDQDWTGTNISFITGPSRTADIELTLTLGVHGPREVHAIFVESP
ncbi:MAG: lactate utilization protein C [Candidatus Methylomirabilia bacterium]